MLTQSCLLMKYRLILCNNKKDKYFFIEKDDMSQGSQLTMMEGSSSDNIASTSSASEVARKDDRDIELQKGGRNFLH